MPNNKEIENPEDLGYNNEEEETLETEEQPDERETSEYDKVFFADADSNPEEEEKADEAEEPAEDPEVEEEAEENAEEEATPEEEAPKMKTLKWNKQEIQVTEDEVMNMAQQNFDITQKYQEVAKLKKQALADIELIDKVKAGDKDALARLLREGEIDPVDMLDYDMEDAEQGTPKQEEPFMSPEVEGMLAEVAKDETLLNDLSEVEKMLPENVVSRMAKDPETFYAIVNEVRSGDANIVMPHVQKNLAQLDDLDRSVVLNDTDAFASFYLNVKNGLIADFQQQQNPEGQQPERSAPPQQRDRQQMNKVSINKTRSQKRNNTGQLDSMSSDKTYNEILDRLSRQ